MPKWGNEPIQGDLPFQTQHACTSFNQRCLFVSSFRLNKELTVYYLRTQNSTHEQFTPRSSSPLQTTSLLSVTLQGRCFNLEVIRMAIIKFLTLWSKRETKCRTGDGNQTLASPVPQTLVFLLQRSSSQPCRSRKEAIQKFPICCTIWPKFWKYMK